MSQLYVCRNGHLVKDKMLAGQECWRCRANERRRLARLAKRTTDQEILALIRWLDIRLDYASHKDGKYCYTRLTAASIKKDFGVDLEQMWVKNCGGDARRSFLDKTMAKRPTFRLGYNFGHVAD